MPTQILPVERPDSLGRYVPPDSLHHWQAAETGDVDAPGLAAVAKAAQYLRDTDVPVGFPTETVYGLAADVTRSAAVRGIFTVKRRPSDNPLIVHVCDLDMVAGLLATPSTGITALPPIYRQLVEKLWPGPLTILLPVPPASAHPRWTLAPEVTAGLPTFGCRLPASALTRTLIRLAGAPLAGPSANASTRPSPTTAQHVVDDLDGRILAVLDGGPCPVGVESTVVDGLCDPPVVLRPGGVSIAQLRAVPGWENVLRAYRDGNDTAVGIATAPRAPGMKYKHYSPKARVVLYEAGGKSLTEATDVADALRHVPEVQASKDGQVLGVIRTITWPSLQNTLPASAEAVRTTGADAATYGLQTLSLDGAMVLEVDLGHDEASVAHGLFSALRDLDARGASVILVEGIDDRGDDMAAAVMNRLRKAASETR